LIFDSKQLIEARTLAPDILDVQGAVDLTAVAPRPDDAADAEHPQVPGDARLAHAQMQGEVVDAYLAELPEVLQDAEPGRVGEGQKVVWKLVPLVLEKHNVCFIRV
jgi:hypothetical protein